MTLFEPRFRYVLALAGEASSQQKVVRETMQEENKALKGKEEVTKWITDNSVSASKQLVHSNQVTGPLKYLST